jgi:hypothetical protein
MQSSFAAQVKPMIRLLSNPARRGDEPAAFSVICVRVATEVTAA